MPKVLETSIRKPIVLVAQIYAPPRSERYRVKDGDSWTTVAARHGLKPWDLIRLNYPTLPANEKEAALEVNWYLEHYVGCDRTTADRRNYVFSASASPGYIHVPRRPPNYARSQLVIPYIYGEIVKNAAGPQAAKIRDQMNGRTTTDAFPSVVEPEDRSARSAMRPSEKMHALLTWRALVRSNGPWDHKPILRRILNLGPGDLHFPIEGDADHEYFYDIWSNFHYGYVGRAAGIDGATLQWGHQQGGAAGKSDPMDVETVQIGIDLWERHGFRLTQKQFHNEILVRRARMLEIQDTPEYRQAVGPDFNHVESITDGK